MPVYDYKCRDCNGITEAVHSSDQITNDENDIDKRLRCEHCGSVGNMFRKISGDFARHSTSTPEEQKVKLKKRAKDHFNKHIKERFHYLNQKNVMP